MKLYNSKITNLPNLPKCVDLNCSNNELTNLTKLPDSLVYLFCEDNKFNFIKKTHEFNFCFSSNEGHSI